MTVTIMPVAGIPDIHPGDDLAAILVDAMRPAPPRTGDDVVITHKIVSRAEGAVRTIGDGPDDHRPVVEEQSAAVLRRRGSLVIAETHHGFICANAGVEGSNAEPGTVVLLPVDPDRSARRLRARIERAFGVEIAVIISDTFGRPWRRGLTDVAIGVAGMLPITDLRGSVDAYGRTLDVTVVNTADEIASAADLVLGKASRLPVAIVRGVEYVPGPGPMFEVVCPPDEDLFR